MDPNFIGSTPPHLQRYSIFQNLTLIVNGLDIVSINSEEIKTQNVEQV
jgi:hypothetical protein